MVLSNNCLTIRKWQFTNTFKTIYVGYPTDRILNAVYNFLKKE